MSLNKTIEIFTKLSSEEMQRLHDFIASPYYNKNETLLALFRYLHRLHPDFPEKKISETAMLKKLDTLGSAGTLHNKMTELFRLTEDFLSLEYNQDAVLKKIGTMKTYKKLKLPRHFELLAARIKKELKQETHEDFNHLWRAHRFEEEMAEGFDNKIQRTAGKTMAPVIDTLDLFHAVKKLRYMCDQANLKNQIGNTYADTFRQQTLDFIQHADLSNTYVFAYSRVYLLFTETDAQKASGYYQALKKSVFDENSVFPPAEARSLLAYMQIYCSQQANKGEQKYVSELFETIQLKIKKNLLLEEGMISPLLFKNIVTCALKLREFIWAEMFISKFSGYIPRAFRDDYSRYSMAQVHYFRGEHSRAIAHLKNISYGKLDIQLNFAVRKLLLRAEIENGANELIPEQIEAYRKHLSRKKASMGMYAELQELFIRNMERLFRAKESERAQTLRMLQAEKNFPEKEWMLQMVQEKKL